MDLNEARATIRRALGDDVFEMLDFAEIEGSEWVCIRCGSRSIAASCTRDWGEVIDQILGLRSRGELAQLISGRDSSKRPSRTPGSIVQTPACN